MRNGGNLPQGDEELTYSLILACEVPDGETIGHAWIAVEHPQNHWIVRGFYPVAQDLAMLTGAPGRICDDWNTFQMAHVRTRTFNGLSDTRIMAAKMKIWEYGGSLRDPEPRRRNGRILPGHTPADDSTSDTPYYLLWDQCATFAIAVCRAAGIDPMPGRPQTPINLWYYLGAEGDTDARNLPAQFRRRG